MGSVSIQVWGVACVAVVKLGSEAGVAGWKLYQRNVVANGSGSKAKVEVKLVGEKQDVKMGMGVGAGGGGKKEL